MASTDSLDFLNKNSLRNYPIKEGVSRVDTFGVFTIPNDFLVDMQLAVSYQPEKRYYVQRIANFDDDIIINIADESDVFVGSFAIDVANHWQYKEYYLEPSESFVGATGTVLLTHLTSIKEQPSGEYLFTLETAELETRVAVPALRGVNRIVFRNATGSSYAMTGDVVIEARTNIRFKEEDGRVIVDVGNGLGLNTLCDLELACIKTINGIPPDETGNFTLDFSDCATLTPIPANTGLLLEDICCKPCVGCNDIEELTQRLMTTETGLLTLRNFYDSLNRIYEDFKVTTTYDCDCAP